MKLGFRDIILTLLSLVLTYIIFKNLISLFDSKDFVQIKKLLQEANYFWLFLSIILGFFAYYIRAIRWKMTLEPLGYYPKKINLLIAVASSYFGNAIIPRSGELLRCVVLKKTDNISVDKSIGTLITERMVDLFFLALTILLAYVLNYRVFNSFIQQHIQLNINFNQMFLLIFIGFVIVTILFILFKSKIQNLTIFKKLQLIFNGFIKGILSIKELKNKKLYLFYSFLIWFSYFLMTYFPILCFEELSNISASEGLFILVMGSIGMIIPTPGGIGSYHAAIILAVSLFGYSPILGSALGFVIHTSHYILGVFSGLIGCIYVYLIQSKIKN